MGEHPSYSTLRFQINEAITDFWVWVEGKQEAKKIGPAPRRQPSKNQTWVPRYASVQEILDEYADAAPESRETLPEVDTAAIHAALLGEIDPAF